MVHLSSGSKFIFLNEKWTNCLLFRTPLNYPTCPLFRFPLCLLLLFLIHELPLIKSAFFADVSDVCVDADNKLVTTPAFMYNGAFHEIHDGVVKMVEKVIELIEVVESIE